MTRYKILFERTSSMLVYIEADSAEEAQAKFEAGAYTELEQECDILGDDITSIKEDK